MRGGLINIYFKCLYNNRLLFLCEAHLVRVTVCYVYIAFVHRKTIECKEV